MGHNVYVGRDVKFDWRHAHLISIGDDATIVDGTRILCHDASSNRRLGLTWVAPVTIGQRTFVGAESLILPGVTLGDDAIVAAGSVVTKDVDAGVVVAGVPARPIGKAADIDAERLAKSAKRPVFRTADYHRDDLPPEMIAELRAAGRSGGYFLSA